MCPKPTNASRPQETSALDAEPRTIAQRWRFRRDLTMFLAHRAGLSQRILADVFDLPRSRISVILQEWADRYPDVP